MEYKVTVIIRTRNRQDLVIRAIESVYNQSMRPNIQCLVINDNSSDSTPGLIRDWLSSHSDFRLDLVNLPTNVKNGGALISSKDHILGNYVIVLDDDDYYVNPNGLEILYDKCISENLDVLFPSTHGGIDAPHVYLMFRSELFKKCPISRIHYTEDHYTHWFSFNSSYKSGFYVLNPFLSIHPSKTNYFDKNYSEDFKLHRIFENLFYESLRFHINYKSLHEDFLRVDYDLLSDHIKPTYIEIKNEFNRLGL